MTRAMVALAALAIVAAEASAQVPAGGEFRVNTQTLGYQDASGTVVDRRGNFVVVWSTRGPLTGYDVFAQRYAASGAPLGGEVRVNSYTTGLQNFADPAMDADGNFIVVWESVQGQTGVYGQRYNANGAPLGGEFQISPQGGRPKVASDPNGNLIVARWGNGPGDPDGVYVRRLRPDGTPVGGELLVNTFTPGQQLLASVTAAPAGNFVVVWDTNNLDGSGYGVFAQRYDAAGNAQGANFRVNAITSANQRFGTAAYDAAGNFVIAFESYFQDGSGLAAIAQRFDANGARIGGEFLLNTYTTGHQGAPNVAVADNGAIVASWNSLFQDGSGYGVFAQRFDPSGVKRGAEFRANTYTTGNQLNTPLVVDSVGNFTVVWSSYGQDGSFNGVYAQRFGGLQPTALAADPAPPTGNGVLEPGEIKEIRPTWRNDSGAPLIVSSQTGNPTGPPGGIPQVIGPVAAYGTLAAGASAQCTTCPVLEIPPTSPRPAAHWDAAVTETIVPDVQGQQKVWLLHVGKSFGDVPNTSPYYRFVETVFHNDVMGGCGGGQFCPTVPVRRDNMAVFVLTAKDLTFVPVDCVAGQEMFSDVPASSPYCRWVEELARRSVIAGCGGGRYCPDLAVTRETLAVYVLLVLDPSINPPACVVPIFNDLPATSPFCRWVEELARRGVVTGCGGGAYCPTLPVSREQMSVFLTVTFGLVLYGP